MAATSTKVAGKRQEFDALPFPIVYGAVGISPVSPKCLNS